MPTSTFRRSIKAPARPATSNSPPNPASFPSTTTISALDLPSPSGSFEGLDELEVDLEAESSRILSPEDVAKAQEAAKSAGQEQKSGPLSDLDLAPLDSSACRRRFECQCRQRRRQRREPVRSVRTRTRRRRRSGARRRQRQRRHAFRREQRHQHHFAFRQRPRARRSAARSERLRPDRLVARSRARPSTMRRLARGLAASVLVWAPNRKSAKTSSSRHSAKTMATKKKTARKSSRSTNFPKKPPAPRSPAALAKAGMMAEDFAMGGLTPGAAPVGVATAAEMPFSIWNVHGPRRLHACCSACAA